MPSPSRAPAPRPTPARPRGATRGVPAPRAAAPRPCGWDPPWPRRRRGRSPSSRRCGRRGPWVSACSRGGWPLPPVRVAEKARARGATAQASMARRSEPSPRTMAPAKGPRPATRGPSGRTRSSSVRPTASTPTATAGVGASSPWSSRSSTKAATELAPASRQDRRCGTRADVGALLGRQPHAAHVHRGHRELVASGEDPEHRDQTALDGDVDARAEALAGAAREADAAAHALHDAARDLEADAAAREQIARLARREAGHEEQREQRVVVGGLGDGLRDQPGLEGARAHVGDVDAGAVVLDV